MVERRMGIHAASTRAATPGFERTRTRSRDHPHRPRNLLYLRRGNIFRCI